jgi:hypothetical protein
MSASSSVLSFDSGQLDLFAEAEAAEQQGRIDAAPTLFDTDQRGYFVRIAAAKQWADDYGHFDCLRRSHAWHSSDAPFVNAHPTATCRPAVLTAALHCDHHDRDCLCVGRGGVYRGACLHCAWEGPLRDGENTAAENTAAEDAHDHAWPGWRELPHVPRRPDTASNSQKTSAALRNWIADVDAIYPAGWLDSGGPIRTRRSTHGSRHVPNRTGFGGYDLCGEVTDSAAA